MSKYIVLDFDGVICNSINECMLVSHHSYYGNIISNLNELAEIPINQKKEFIKYRYLVGPAYEYFYLWESIKLKNKTKEKVDVFFNRQVKNIKPKIKNKYLNIFYENRKKLKNYNINQWIKLNPFYLGISDALSKKINLNNIFIVTSKDYESVNDLLIANNIQISSSHIYSYEKSLDKKILFKMLIDENNIEVNNINFIDDKLSHLENVLSLGIKCYLALWGYISPTSYEKAKKIGIKPVEQSDFVPLLNEIGVS